jgi:hypothetical protein
MICIQYEDKKIQNCFSLHNDWSDCTYWIFAIIGMIQVALFCLLFVRVSIFLLLLPSVVRACFKIGLRVAE